MLNKKKICVVVPAYNEEQRIGEVIKTMPAFVDLIIVVDDQSTDKTISETEKAAKLYRKNVEILALRTNQGVGGAIVAGYKLAAKRKMVATAVMAGDAQMDPAELKDLCLPIIRGEAEYVKGNRLIYGQAWDMMPKVRYLGNSVLSLLTKITSGYWHVADSQTGYAAISLDALEKLRLDNLYKRYGFPNDLLVHLNIIHARVKEIPIKPIYHADGKSGIKISKVIFTIGWLLIRRFFWRLKIKYIIQDFHPLVFFYFFSMMLGAASLVFLLRVIYVTLTATHIPTISSLGFVFCAVMASQFLFFAMWFDMDNNKDLRVK